MFGEVPARYRYGYNAYRGNNNRQKARVLIALYIWSSRGPVDYRKLSELSGVSIEYLEARLGNLTKWKYINRRRVKKGNTLVYGYSIAARGKRFLLDNNITPPEIFNELATEVKKRINQHRDKRNNNQ